MTEIIILIIVVMNLTSMLLCFRSEKMLQEGKQPFKDLWIVIYSFFLSAAGVFVSRLSFGYNKGKKKFFLIEGLMLALNIVQAYLILFFSSSI